MIFSLFSLGYVLAAAVALAMVPHFGWQSAFIVAIVPAGVLFLVRRGIRESHRYTDVQAKIVPGVAKPRLWKLPGVRRRLVAGWLIYTANAVGYWGVTVFLTTYIVKRFHASPIDAIRYALLFFLLQVVFVYLGTALADWVGRRPSAILAAVIEFFSTILAATSHSLDRYLVFGAIAIATLGWLWGVGDTYVSQLFPTVLRGTGFGIAVGGPSRVHRGSRRGRLGHNALRAADAIPRARRPLGADAGRLPARTRDERQRTRRPGRRGPHRRPGADIG